MAGNFQSQLLIESDLFAQGLLLLTKDVQFVTNATQKLHLKDEIFIKSAS